MFGKRVPQRAVAPNFAAKLLRTETDGFGIDATSIGSPPFVGGPQGGWVSVKDTTTPANAHYNISLDSSDVTQSGTSPKMVLWGSSPFVRWTPHNYCLQSQTLDNAAWTAGAGVTITANDTTSPDGNNTAELLSHTANENNRATVITVISGFNYTFSCYAKANASSWIRLFVADDTSGTNGSYAFFDLTNGATGTTGVNGTGWTAVSSSIVGVGSGWFRCSLVANVGATTLYGYLRCASADNSTAASGNSAWFWGAQLNRGTSATPYLVTTATVRIGIPQAYDKAKEQYGILLEPAATNLALRSEEFDSVSWAKTDTTITADNITAPNGTTTADLATQGVAGAQRISQAITITANATYSISFYLKVGNNSWVRASFFDTVTSTNNVIGWFNLSTGATGSVQNNGTGSGATVAMVDAGSGWYRCTLTGAVGNSVTAATFSIRAAPADNDTTAVNSATYYVWGGQAETGTVASSYIHTLNSTVTRAADIVSLAVTTYPHSATEGTFWGWCRFLTISEANGFRFCQLDDGTGNEVIQPLINIAATPDDFGLAITDGGVNQVDATVTHTGTLSTTAGNKLAAFYKLNDSGVLADGGTEVKDTGCTMPTVTQCRIGTNSTGTGGKGFIYQLAYVPRRLTQGEMQTKTK